MESAAPDVSGAPGAAPAGGPPSGHQNGQPSGQPGGKPGRRANGIVRPTPPPAADQRWVMRITQEPPSPGLSAAALAERILRAYPGAPVQRHAGSVGGHAATIVRGVPGAEGLTRIAVVEANGRIYRIVSRDDAQGKGS